MCEQRFLRIRNFSSLSHNSRICPYCRIRITLFLRVLKPQLKIRNLFVRIRNLFSQHIFRQFLRGLLGDIFHRAYFGIFAHGRFSFYGTGLFHGRRSLFRYRARCCSREVFDGSSGDNFFRHIRHSNTNCGKILFYFSNRCRVSDVCSVGNFCVLDRSLESERERCFRSATAGLRRIGFRSGWRVFQRIGNVIADIFPFGACKRRRIILLSAHICSKYIVSMSAMQIFVCGQRVALFFAQKFSILSYPQTPLTTSPMAVYLNARKQ